MFQVICIKEKPMFGPPQTEWLIKCGEIYEVIEIEEKYSSLYYRLNIHPDAFYASEHFSPLSDIDETNFKRSWVEKENKELV